MTNWEEQIELPEKGPDIEYAYILKLNEEPVKCTKEKLYETIESDKDILFVATPQNSTFIIPGSDFETLQPLLKKKKSSIKTNLNMGIIYTVFMGGLMLLSSLTSDRGFWSNRNGKFYILVFGIIPILSGLYELFSIRKINESNFYKESYEIKFNFWVGQKNIYSIFIISGILIIITIFQFITGLQDSVELAGLVKSKTLAGEYWRLLTCILLHGSILHILFNSIAIFVIGHMVIRITGFSYFVIVFLFSGISGSLFSLFLMPAQTSVGASGGIMGLIGFILIISIKFKENVPRNIIKSMLVSIILIAIMGLSAYDIIDNAAHGGGLIGGVLIGLILIRKRKNMIPYKPTALINILGIVSTIILIGGIVMIIRQI